MNSGKRFIQNISANTFQLIITQCLGLVIFYVLSKQLDKATFGNFNWALAVLLTSFGILSCGMDQLVVKKIATGEDTSSVLSSYLFHILLAAIFFYAILFLNYFLFPSFFNRYFILLFLSIGKLFAFLATPFKQVCVGLERFRPLLFMSIGSNVVKAFFLFSLFALDLLSIKLILVIFVAGDFVEFIVAILVSRKYLHRPLHTCFNIYTYKRLFKEALPQLGTVIIAAAMARLDWILIGIFLPAAKLAEYSFAYKVFEVSTFPLLVIAPLLVPLFSKVFKTNQVDNAKLMKLKLLLYIQLAIASFISMILVIIWVPVIDFITDGKYGNVNSSTVFILSLSMPFLYFNNFMWTINFSRSKLRMIFLVFATTFIINAVADLILIPLFRNEGAAAGWFLALLTQSVYFLKVTKIEGLDNLVYPLFVCPVCALLTGLISTYCFNHTSTILIVSTCIYLVSVIIWLRTSVPQIKILRSVLEM